ncbi:MAG TPA: response regulator [Candidatus Dormibacteraeota bacterium]
MPRPTSAGTSRGLSSRSKLSGNQGDDPDQIRVVIVDDSHRTAASLSRLLAFEASFEVVGTAHAARLARTEVARLKPQVVVMDVNLPDQDGIALARDLRAEHPGLGIVLISVEESPALRRRGQQAGAAAYLLKPFEGEELVAAVRGAVPQDARSTRHPAPRRRVAPAESTQELPVARSRRGHLDTLPPTPAAAAPEAAKPVEAAKPEEPPAPPLPPPPPLRPRGRNEAGHVIAIFSGKGGVGKSVVALNLAAMVGTETGDDVALIDLDLQFGDLAVLLGLQPKDTIADVSAAKDVDAAFLGSLMPEAPGNLRVLCSPLSPELADLVRPEHVAIVIDTLKAAFDYVVVDLSQHLDDVSLTALDKADRIVLLIDNNLPAIKDAKLAFRLFATLGIPGERIVMVLNRANAPSEVTVTQIEANLQWKVGVKVPSEGGLVLRSVQRAVPAVLMEPDSEFALSVRELAGTLIPLPDAGREAGRRVRRGLFSRR